MSDNEQNNERVVYPDELEEIKSNSIEEPPAEPATDATDKDTSNPNVRNRNMIQAPANCPPGYKMGADGKCREVFN